MLAQPGAAAPSLHSRAHMTVTSVSKAFHGRPALRDVSFSVSEGEFVAVLGPSGAGKTTLFRCMTGLIVPDSGAVQVDGADVAGLRGRARRRIAMIFQQFNLIRRLSALENVLAGRLGHVPAWRGLLRRFSRADRLLALQCLERVGLMAEAEQRADRLSGGQQQRVAIARALAQQPSLIVADEPVASLDPKSSGSVLELLRSIAHSDGVSVVSSLHQVGFARSYASRIIGLSAGRIVADIPGRLFDDSAATRLYNPFERGVADG
jgi:phosphonate transport system ATP-binding protein